MEWGEAGSSDVRVVTRRHIHEMMQGQNLPNILEKLEYAQCQILANQNYTVEQSKEIKQKFSNFKSEYKRRWSQTKKIDLFLNKNKEWLDGTITFPKVVSQRGRPSKEFEELSDRSKRRFTEELRNSIDTEVLTYAAQIKLGTSGKRDAATVLKDITSTPTRASKYKKAYCSTLDQHEEQLSAKSALAMLIEADLSRQQYDVIRATNKRFYPCYSVLQKAKNDCYPKKESYIVNETSAEINLQTLLDLTATRLIMDLEEVVQSLTDEERNDLLLICKWGCDGSQQSQYKQTFKHDSDSDANIFQSSFVPIQIVCVFNKRVIWQNPTPSSPRYCRPIRIKLTKESTDIINEEISYIQEQINSIQKMEISIFYGQFSVKYQMLLTMVDGKVCNAAMHNSATSRCYICGCTSKDFNDLTSLKNATIKPEALKFGLSILHARIRLFENLLHISYKLPIEKWQLKLEHEKMIVKENKSNIQKEFRKKMGLIVDVPKPGYGNTNDGNTSRRFFCNPELSSEITGLNIDLISRLRVILETISSGYKINVELFRKYTLETAELYVHLYPWYPMTPTMHKILVHAPIIIDNALLPVGQLSEEAAEARNKYFRLYRENHSRKMSRTSCNLDVINRLLLNSDPVLTGMRRKPRKKSKPFLKETLALLLPEIQRDLNEYLTESDGNEYEDLEDSADEDY